MVELLAKLFIRDWKNVGDPRVRADYGILCALLAICFNVLLAVSKFLIGRAANSVAITADAVNNLTDAGSAALLLLGFRLSTKRADTEHPFGHGRFEYVAGLVVSGLILLTAVRLGEESVRKLFAPAAMAFSWPAVGVLVLAIGAKVYMCVFTRRTARKLDSSAMEATAADYLSDSVSTAVVLACMLLFRFAGVDLDAWGGLAVSLLILKTGLEAARDTLRPLLGQKGDPATVERAEEILAAYPEITGVHDMIVHDYGPGRLYISLHAEVDGSGDIFALHDAIDRAAAELDAALGCEAVIHMDPVDLRDEALSAMRGEVEELVYMLDPALSVHDFRMVPGPTHTKLVFDVLAPYKSARSDKAIREEIAARVKAAHPECSCVIRVDKAYI